MNIAVIGDVHDARSRLAITLQLLEGREFDLALLTGDVGQDPPWNEPQRRLERATHDASVRGVVERIRAALLCEVIFVPGNHDLPDPGDLSGVASCDGRVLTSQGLRIAGLGGAGPGIFGFPYEWNDEDADQRLEELLAGDEGQIDIFLSHTPPFETRLDRILQGRHVGSRSVRAWISRARPRLFVCGHIHEAAGVQWLDGVPCLNAGALGEPYSRKLIWSVTWGECGPERIESLEALPSGREECRVWTADTL